MAISYATTGFGFVDSQYGTAANATGLKTIIPQVVDKKYHKEVRVKSFFQKAGIIGPDLYREGSVSETAPGYPVVRKTDLEKQKGDVIKMGLRHKYTVAHTNGGKVLDAQLVDNEGNLDFSSLKVSIERHRFGLRGNAGMNEQRNPYEPQGQMFDDELQNTAAELLDTSILYAAHTGWSPNLLRAHGTTNCDPSEVVKTLFGNDVTLDTTRTVADMLGAGTDNLKAKTFDIAATLMEQNFFDPVMINGEPWWLALISAKAAMVLRQDSTFTNALQNARERSPNNPLFRYAEMAWGNVLIFKYEKVRTILGGFNPNSLTVGSNNITEVAYAAIGGGLASTDLHQMLVFGANAVAHAEAQFKTGLIRAENDYGNIIGRAADLIFGSRRCSWVKEDTTTITEQGIAKIVNSLVL